MSCCIIPPTEYRPHTVFVDSKPYVLNCRGEAVCKVCRTGAAARSWKTIHEIIKEKFGTPRLKGE